MEMNGTYYDFGLMSHSLETIVFNEIVTTFTTLVFLLLSGPVVPETLFENVGASAGGADY